MLLEHLVATCFFFGFVSKNVSFLAALAHCLSLILTFIDHNVATREQIVVHRLLLFVFDARVNQSKKENLIESPRLNGVFLPGFDQVHPGFSSWFRP